MDDGTTTVFEHDTEKTAIHFDKTTSEQYENASHRIGWDNVVQQLVDQASERFDQALERFPNPNTDIKIADLGTGPGALSADFLAKAFEQETEIHGLDLSRESLKEAIAGKKITTGIPHPISEVSKHIGGMTEYDAVTISGVMDFVTEGEMSKTIKEVGMMLKKGGILAMTVEPTGADNPGVNANQHDLDKLEKLLAENGITDVEITPTTYKAWGAAAKNNQTVIDTTIITAIKTEDPNEDLSF